MPGPPVRLVTRGSPLALAQAELVRSALAAARPGLVVEVQILKTRGDRDRASSIAQLGTGVFTKELEEALLEGRADLAVHSLKDLPTESPRGLVVAATLPRADTADVLCSRGGVGLAGLPVGARVGTSSPRRRAQILERRPDLVVLEVRGNVDTRLGRISLPADDPRALDAVVLAKAGLDRLDRGAAATEDLKFLPAPGQGAIGLQARADDGATLDALAAVDDAPTTEAAGAERLLHSLLGGGCRAPVGALGRREGPSLRLDAVVLALDGRRAARASASGPTGEAAAKATFERLVSQGALEILAGARTSDPT